VPYVNNPDIAPDCPRCGQPLAYRCTGTGSRSKGDVTVGSVEVKQYFCEQHGFYSLWPDGLLKYIASGYRQTELIDLE
jgi:hypothetical protein